MENLTPQEEEFCRQYIGNNGNGKQAAIAAGYPENEAQSIAADLLKRDDIQAELELYNNPETIIDPKEYWDAEAKFEEA